MYKADSNKVAYNNCFGGFSLSEKAESRLVELGVLKENIPYLNRHDLRLIQVIEELKNEANSRFSYLKIETILGNKYRIDEYDGLESVQTPDDIDWIEI